MRLLLSCRLAIVLLSLASGSLAAQQQEPPQRLVPQSAAPEVAAPEVAAPEVAAPLPEEVMPARGMASELRSFHRHYPGHGGPRMAEPSRKRRHLTDAERHQLRRDVRQAGRELYRASH